MAGGGREVEVEVQEVPEHAMLRQASVEAMVLRLWEKTAGTTPPPAGGMGFVQAELAGGRE